MTPLYVIRPEPGCAATVAAARGAGLAAHGFALFAVEPVDWAVPEGAFDLLLAGSANVFRHGGAGLAALRGLPVWAVGQATAAAARAAGFAVERTGRGGLQAVLEQVPADRRVLRLAGAERVELAPPGGVTMAERVVYASRALPLPAELAARLAQGGVVAVHSAEAMRHFAGECLRLGLARGRIALATIGPRVSAAAGEGWWAVATANSPDDAALLASARDLCQDAAAGSRHVSDGAIGGATGEGHEDA